MQPKNKRKKIVVVLGPTASGKSDLAVSVAKRFNGEIISADSRQIYKGMDIGTGKIPRDQVLNFSRFYSDFVENSQLCRRQKSTDCIANSRICRDLALKFQNYKQLYFHKKIPHYCLDIASPKRKFSVSQYQKYANQAISLIFEKNKVPILCGGTAFYIKAVIEGFQFPKVAPNWQKRKFLERKSPEELYLLLEKLDPHRAKTIEKKNPRRLIRALEIIMQTKKSVPLLRKKPEYNPLFIGIGKNQEELNKKIKKRLKKEIKEGLVAEVKKLRKSGLSWERLESFGLEYEWAAKYLQKKITRLEMEEKTLRDIIRFSKKQMAWWKTDKKINWIKNTKEAHSLIKEFLAG